jgi:hypothetical protein
MSFLSDLSSIYPKILKFRYIKIGMILFRLGICAITLIVHQLSNIKVNSTGKNMTTQKHLEILLQGEEEWNEWRMKNLLIIPNLRGANLRGVNLYRMNLTQANLRGANLRLAYLRGANLRGANLRGANLRRANLGETNLGGANFSEANLREVRLGAANLILANLSGANLNGANLREANLSGAKLEKAQFGYTFFFQSDLTDVKYLETCIHFAPSNLDHYTIVKSGGLPEAFLRGCGLPDHYIELIPSLFLSGDAIKYYSCFISYSTKDKDFAERLYADLQNKGVRCFFAPKDMKIGDKIRSTLDESIRVYDKLLLVLSENSINSLWVEKEVETAFEKESKNQKNQTVLFPIRLDEAVMETNTAWAADVRRTRHIGNFTNWKDHDAYKKAFERLIRDLQEA